ncbi:MAG: TonB-dependent receptor [Ketobacter sp.]
MGIPGNKLKATGLLTAAAMAALSLTPVSIMAETSTPKGLAAEQTRQYAIPAGTLDQVLNQFASESGILLAIDGNLTQGKTSQGLQGRFSTEAGLERLLNETGLQAQPGDAGYTLKLRDQSRLPPVKVSGSVIAAERDTVTYDHQAIEQIQPQDIKDLFQNESAVAVGGSIPVNQKVYVRGVEETAMLVTVDGARQNNKVFHHNATNLIDPKLLKAATASAGVAPADAGPGALGGSLVYETVDVEDMLAPDQKFGGFVDGRYASNGEQWTTSGSLYGREGKFEALGYVNKIDGDNYEDGTGEEVNYSESALISGLAKIAYGSEQEGRFELSRELVNDDAARPYRANFGGLTVGRPTPESRNYDLSRDNTVFSYTLDRSKGGWNPEVTVAKSETELETIEVPLAAPETTVAYNGITESYTATMKNRSYTGFAEIVSGVDYYNDSALFRFEGDPDLEENAENVGAFIQLRQQLVDALDLSYGLRYDRQAFEGTDDSSHDDSGASGNLFAEYHINDYVAVNAGYAQVWGGVALAENYILNSAWVYTDLKPVESQNYTVGVVLTVEGFLAEANSYRTKIDNGRVPSYSGGPDLVADFDIEGYDLALGFSSDRAHLSIKYSNVDSEKDGQAATSYDGNYFTAPLGELIAVNGAYNFPAQRLTLGVSAEVSLENDAVEDSGAKQDGYTVINMYADYQLLDSLALRFSVDNLNNEAYTDRASYGQEFTTVKPLLEPGRSYTLNARYTF